MTSATLLILLLLIGFVLGAALASLPLRKARRAADRADEARRKLLHDRQRLFGFMDLMAEALGEGLTLQALQQRIVHSAIVCTDAQSGCLFELTERETVRTAATEGLFPPHRPLSAETKAALTSRAKLLEQVLRAEEFPISEGMVGRVARSRRGELLADAAADEQIVKHDDPALLVRSVIVVPLTFRERLFGVLAVANPVGDRLFSEDDFQLMESLAEQAALALHNAESLHLHRDKQQLDLDLAIASDVQQMLLPRETVQFAGLEINARYMPAKQVGGDLYDVFPLSDTQLGVVVADVAGKGIAASLLMAICRTNLRQIAPRHRSPAAALCELNRAVEVDIRVGHYITVLYAVIDTAANCVTIARAGHELPLMARRGAGAPRASVGFVGTEGMAVGMVPDALFTEALVDRTEPFQPGDMLVLYTDGLTEAPNDDGKEFSGDRLADAVCAGFGQSPRQLNDRVLQAVGQFTAGAAQRDDFTLVTVRRV